MREIPGELQAVKIFALQWFSGLGGSVHIPRMLIQMLVDLKLKNRFII
jgi:hypothetical protein